METSYNFEDIFEHKTLDKIVGEPDAKSIQKLFKQLKRNARSVASPLGGGHNSKRCNKTKLRVMFSIRYNITKQ